MSQDDLESELKRARLTHLTDDELGLFNGLRLDKTRRARAEAHLQLCPICERRLLIISEENADPSNREITGEDLDLVKRLISALYGAEQALSPNKAAAEK